MHQSKLLNILFGIIIWFINISRTRPDYNSFSSVLFYYQIFVFVCSGEVCACVCVWICVCKRKTQDGFFLHCRKKYLRKNVRVLQEQNSSVSHIFKLKLPVFEICKVSSNRVYDLKKIKEQFCSCRLLSLSIPYLA